MLLRLNLIDKNRSSFSVENFTEQKFQVQKNGETGYFSDPAGHTGEGGGVGRENRPELTDNEPNRSEKIEIT